MVKLAALSTNGHSNILFTINDEIIGYTAGGKVGRIGHEWLGRCNRWPHPALSHDGLRVAYVADGEAEGRPLHNCRIVVHELATSAEKTIVSLPDDPGEISWSWDDSRIVYFDRSTIDVSLIDSTRNNWSEKGAGSFFVWYPMQWLRRGESLVVQRGEEVPSREPKSFTTQAKLFRIEREDPPRLIALGSNPSVSPQSDQIAYLGEGGIAAINPDGSGKHLLAKAPRTGPLFQKELLWGPIVWSPDGQQLFFGAIESEDHSDKLFLLDIRRGQIKTFASHTSIRIRGWR